MNTRFPPIPFLPLTLLALLLLTTCSGTENKNDTITGLHPIDIWAPKFFKLLRPWKEGRLATIDGWGRFAEISFIGAKGMRIKKLCNFPRMQIDPWTFTTWPEAGLMVSGSNDIIHHIAAIDDGKTKTQMPIFTRAHYVYEPVLLDPHEGLVGYSYAFKMDDKYNYLYDLLYVYNYKEDRMVHKIEDKGFGIYMRLRINDQYTYCRQRWVNEEGKRRGRGIFYNWRTEEIIENDFTRAFSQISANIQPPYNIHLGKRYLLGKSSAAGKRQIAKLTWDENYSDIKITPISYLVPAGRWLEDFTLSTDGEWGHALVGGYRGLRENFLYKRAFFHMDERYPNGISMPVIVDDYESDFRDYSAFVEHPVHGMCFAQEWYKEGKLYLRLYKMSEVLAEINK
jgi:hypothetical protein